MLHPLAGIILFAKMTLKENLRNRSLGYLVLFAIIASAGVLLFVDFSLQEQTKIIKDVCFSSMIFFSVIMAIFLGMRQIENDFETKTIYQVTTNPVNLSHYLAGRIVAMMVIIGGALTLMCLLFFCVLKVQQLGFKMSVADEAAAFDAGSIFTTDFLRAAIVIFLQAVVMNVISFFWSGLVKGPKIFLLCLLFYVAGHLSELFSQMISGFHKIFSFFMCLVFLWIPNLAYFNLTDSITLGQSPSWEHILNLLGYALVFVATYSIMTYAVLIRRLEET